MTFACAMIKTGERAPRVGSSSSALADHVNDVVPEVQRTRQFRPGESSADQPGRPQECAKMPRKWRAERTRTP